MARPGVPGVTYFDVQVLVGDALAGYVIVTNGKHDVPITAFSTAKESPTDNLLRVVEPAARRHLRR